MTIETKNDATTAVAVPAGDAEAGAGFAAVYESPADAAAAPAAAGAADGNDDAGKGLGIAMTVILIVGVVCSFLRLTLVSSVCYIVGIVLSSVLACGCCANYELKPNVKRFATATLVCLLLSLACSVALVFALFAEFGREEVQDLTPEDIRNAGAGIVALGILGWIFNILAIVFAALFTFGRQCCARS